MLDPRTNTIRLFQATGSNERMPPYETADGWYVDAISDDIPIFNGHLELVTF